MTVDTAVPSKIRDFIARNFLFSDQGFGYPDNASFLEEGIIDSLGIIELVSFVEKEFAISVADQELLPANFDSVQALTTYIAGKQAKAS
jgi:acyl carrier protein